MLVNYWEDNMKGSLCHEKDQLSFPLSHEMCTYDNSVAIIMVHSVVINEGYFYHHYHKQFQLVHKRAYYMQVKEKSSFL